MSQMFGGLDICSLEALVAKNGQEYIIEVNDCAMGLLGESQEEDRRNIADVVLKAMENICVPPDSAAKPVTDNNVTDTPKQVPPVPQRMLSRKDLETSDKGDDSATDDSPQRKVKTRTRRQRSDSEGK